MFGYEKPYILEQKKMQRELNARRSFNF